MTIVILFLAAMLVAATPVVAESLDDLERVAVEHYLDDVARGARGQPAMVDRFAGLSWPGVRFVIERYAALDEPVDPAIHRAFRSLLERTTRTVLLPAAVRERYAADLVRLTSAAADDELSRRVFARLVANVEDRRTADLIVRLTPCVSLERLADAAESTELLQAWNRRLARGPETRTLPGLKETLTRIAEHPPSEPSGAVYEAWLEFLGGWPETRGAFEDRVRQGLAAGSEAAIVSTLRVLEKKPALGGLVVATLQQHLADPTVVEAALEVLAADEHGDHAAALRDVWPRLPGPPSRAQYLALLAMAVHPQGNEAIALAALQAEPFEFVDPALALLRQGPEPIAVEAVRLLLNRADRGHEEALRLATLRRLTGFEPAAVKLVLDESQSVIVRQAAVGYLAHRPGVFRRQVLPLLGIRNGDLRLAAIQCCGPTDGLSADDRDVIGPLLIQVAQHDVSEGHRQEAIFALGTWRDRDARPFLEKVLEENPPVVLAEQSFDESVYWQYRHRLVALVGLARLDDASARTELESLHRRGGPTEKMDVLLACLSLGECPPWVTDDLEATEPKLLATAARLIVAHGSPEQRRRLGEHCGAATAFQAFADSGIDDHNLLRWVREAGHAEAD